MFPRSARVTAAIVAGLVLLAWAAVLGPRVRTEAAHRQVTVALDYQQLLTLAQNTGIDLDDWLQELRAAGFDHLALAEDNPLWLEQRGFCYVVEGFFITKSVPQKDLHGSGTPLIESPEAAKARKMREKPKINWMPDEASAAFALGLPAGDCHLLFPIEATGGNLLARLVALNAVERLGPDRVRLEERPEAGMVVLSLKGNVEKLVLQGLGFASPTGRHLKQAGFGVIPRLRNQRALAEPAKVAGLVAEAARMQTPGPQLFIGEGDEILGFPKALPQTAQALREQGLLFGYVEFSKQSGDRTVADRLVPQVVRVHSISDEEMEIYTPERALRRYLLAVTERNVRVVYLKPFLIEQQGVNLRDFNTAYFTAVRDALVAQGFQLSAMDNGTVRNPVRPWPVSEPVPPPGIWRNLLALGIAVLAPLLALYLLTSQLPAFHARAERGDRWGAGAMALLWLWGWTFAGALLLASLLSEPHYMLQVRSFSGVNVGLLGPVLLAAVLWVRVLVPEAPQRIWDQAVLLGSFPVHIKHLVAGGIVLLAAMVLVLRSGNEPLGGVSPIELAFRAFMGDLLDVRPRTKEFLVGHPALVIGLYLLFQRRESFRPWAFPALTLGTLGMTSVINTFQHLHTPLLISVQRTLVGMGMGLVLGLVICGVIEMVSRLLFRPPPTTVPAPLPESA